MARDFKPVERDQQFLMPPSIKDWLPEDHFAWFVIDSVAQLDLTDIEARYRREGQGRAAFDPQVMVGLLFYAYAKGVRSSREIERRLIEDVAFRVIASNQRPDHSTICRFRQNHETALGELFVQVLRLCVDQGLVDARVVAIDGTKIAADASDNKNLTKDQLEKAVQEMFDEARRTDEAEDELHGDRRGDELPDHLVDRATRLEWLKEQLASREASEPPSQRGNPKRINTTDPEARTMHDNKGHFVTGYNAQAVVTDDHIIIAADVTDEATDRTRLVPMTTQASDNLGAAGGGGIDTVVGDAGYLSAANVTADLGCDVLVAPGSSRAEPRTERPRVARTRALIAEMEQETDRRAAIIERALARNTSIKELAEELGVLQPRASVLRKRYRLQGRDGIVPANMPRPPTLSAPELMAVKLQDPRARTLLLRRSQMIEPVFGHVKHNLGVRRMQRRGLPAGRSEWKIVAAAHNLMKLWKAGSRNSELPGFAVPILGC